MAIKDHKKVLKALSTWQSSERDSRELARESLTFVRVRGGQWEDKVTRIFSGKPRYEFDRVYPVIKTITGDLQDIEFGAKVVEAGSGADNEIAETYEGMLRSIQNMSNFPAIMGSAAEHVVTSGFDAWEVVSDWADVDAFEQDLLIEPVQDALNRVWFGPSSKVDHSDCKEAVKLTAISRSDYEKEYPKGGMQSVGSDSEITDEDDDIVIGQYYCIREEKAELHLLSNDKIMRADQFDPVKKDMEAAGVTIVRSRERSIPVCYIRKFDGADWLGDEETTVFAYIPLVPVYGHYDVIEGERSYFGVTEKLKDPQRIYNYAKSREISEGALAPIEKIAATKAQVAGHEAQNSTLNNDHNPLFIYNPDAKAPPPFKLQGNQPNANLALTQQGAALDIQEISNSYNPARGQGLAGHSGVAYEMLQNKSNLSSISFVKALKLAVHLTAKIIIDAIPKVYDTRSRQVRLLNEDGSSQYKSINEEIYSPGEEPKVLRDLSQGHYDVVITTGKTFASRKTEGVEALMTVAQAYPAILDEGADILIKSMDAPYINQLSDRIRAQMVKTGRIPEPQLTDDERAKLQAEMEAAANQPPDPMQEATIQAIMMEVQKGQMEAQKSQVEMQEKMQSMQIKMMEQERKNLELQLKMAQGEAGIQKTQAETIEKLTKSEHDYAMPGDAANIQALTIAGEM